jgi:hypothetical protein
MQHLTGWLCGDTLQEAVGGNPKLKAGGGRTPWPMGHVARPAGHHLVCYRLNQVSNPSLDPYKCLPTGENQSNTHYLKFSTCKGFNLVIVVQVKPCQESRVESSICASSESSHGDW